MATDLGGQGAALIYLGGDAGLADALRTSLAGRARFAAFDGASPIAEAIQASVGGVLVLDARRGTKTHDASEVLAQVEAQERGRPIWVCLTDRGDLSARLNALRGGARACFAGTELIDDLCRRLLELSGAAAETPYRVLVVDDQEVAARFAVRVLEKAGIQARAVCDAMVVLDAVGEMRPDLVLMDLHMPGADGIELTRILREHEEFFNLPVVFVSGEGDPNQQMETLRVGGNDFLSKPVPAGLLVETVRRRIEAGRQALLRGAMASAHDAATGLWSRGFLLQQIDQALAGSTERTPGTGVLYLRIDRALAADEQPGLLEGVFAEVARFVGCQPDAAGLAARVGHADLALLARRPSLDALLTSAEGLRAMIAGQAWTLDGVRLPLTASIGIAPLAALADDAITVISRAKKACFSAQRAGGNRCELYAPVLPRQLGPVRFNRLAELVREALAGHGLSLSYQPIVALRRRSGESYQALLRLRAADGEPISPLDFLPVARSSGLMPDIDRWVVGHALDETLRRRAEHPGLQFLICQSLATAAAPGWVNWLRDEIASRDLIRQRPALVFEIDEVAARPGDARTCFASLHRLGIDTCLNGLTDSPQALSLLAGLGVTRVRLHEDVLTAIDGASLLTLVEAAHREGAAVIATGIEHPQAIAKAWGCRVDYIQGNFIQPASDTLDFDFAATDLVQ